MSRTAFYAIALAVFTLDRLTKVWAVSALSNGNTVPVIPGYLKFNLVHNRGSAFGLLQGSSVFLAALGIAAVAVMLWAERRHLFGGMMRIAVALELGGALGNLLDRAKFGYVIDFVELDWRGRNIWPVFNVADSAITVGAILLALCLWNMEKHSAGAQTKPAGERNP